MQIDLNTLSLKELKDLHSQIAKAISSFESRKKSEAMAAIENMAKSFGFSLDDLFGRAAASKHKVAKAKYANPANKSETWSGRGRRPRWVEAAIKAGHKLEDLLL